MKSLIIPVGSPAVHPELLCGDTESYQIEQSSNPAVEGVLIISVLDIFSQHVDVGVRFFLQANVLDESHTDRGKMLSFDPFLTDYILPSDVEEDAHHRELDNPPG